MKKNNKTTITTKQWKIKCSYKYKTPNLTWLTKAWYCPNLSDHIHRGSQLFQSKCVHQLERVSIGAGIWKVELYLKVLQKKINKVCKTFVNVFIYFFFILTTLAQHLFLLTCLLCCLCSVCKRSLFYNVKSLSKKLCQIHSSFRHDLNFRLSPSRHPHHHHLLHPENKQTNKCNLKCVPWAASNSWTQVRSVKHFLQLHIFNIKIGSHYLCCVCVHWFR